jgi:hypothetical protein
MEILPYGALPGCSGYRPVYSAHTARRVIYGHPFETANASLEKEAVEAFFNLFPGMTPGGGNSSPSEVDYVFFGPREIPGEAGDPG